MQSSLAMSANSIYLHAGKKVKIWKRLLSDFIPGEIHLHWVIFLYKLYLHPEDCALSAIFFHSNNFTKSDTSSYFSLFAILIFNFRTIRWARFNPNNEVDDQNNINHFFRFTDNLLICKTTNTMHRTAVILCMIAQTFPSEKWIAKPLRAKTIKSTASNISMMYIFFRFNRNVPPLINVVFPSILHRIHCFSNAQQFLVNLFPQRFLDRLRGKLLV